MKKKLSIDIETYSDIEITKGVYRYVDTPNFEILLFAYAYDDNPVEIIDLACGETLPQEVIDDLQNNSIEKHAYNAQFERICLSKYLGIKDYLDPSQWYCTMVKAMYLGLPGKLGAVAKALNLEEQKDTAGTLLIKYFSVPCKPSKVNGQRTRNLPHHDFAKWDLFVSYCKQDVETERAISKRLEFYPITETERRLYIMDQRINDCGVGVDLDLVNTIINFNNEYVEKLNDRAQEITGLDNPNSIAQLKEWLIDEGLELDSLTKAKVTELMESNLDDHIQEVLELRQDMSKTSVKKYEMLQTATCSDSRIRGCLQFLGANRTGRWCLTGDHEILTKKNGWVKIENWCDESIAVWNSLTESISFQKAKPLTFDYEGEMYFIESQRISQISTPEHKLPHFNKKTGVWEAKTVLELQNIRPVIPFTGNRKISTSLEHTELRVLIMVQADGHFTEESDLKFRFKKIRKIERCKKLLRQAGIMFVEKFYSDKVTQINIKNRDLPIYLRQFKNKEFGTWLFDESPDVLFEELEYWDSYRCGPNSIQYSTCNKMNADIIQACAHLSGRAATIIEKNRSANWKNAYVVNIWLNPGNRNEIRDKAKIIDFKGKVYCAETTTGYFLVRRGGKVWVTGNSGRLVQLQNLPQNKLEEIDALRGLVKSQEFDYLMDAYPSITNIFSQLIRTSFVAPEGKTFAIADYSAIEARVIAWLADETWVMDVFANEGDIYKATASKMFDVPIENIDKQLRAKGKVATLALGYQGSTGALEAMGALKMGIPQEELPGIVKAWRKTNKNIVKLWKTYNDAAIQVIKTGNPIQLKHGIKFLRDDDFFYIELPSGRRLSYFKPSLSGNDGYTKIKFQGVEQVKKTWGIKDTYGGKLVENVVQAIARDCLAEAMLLVHCEFPIVMHVHDELIAEVEELVSNQKLDQIKRLMNTRITPIQWAPGLYLKAEGYCSKFYKKD